MFLIGSTINNFVHSPESFKFFSLVFANTPLFHLQKGIYRRGMENLQMKLESYIFKCVNPGDNWKGRRGTMDNLQMKLRAEKNFSWTGCPSWNQIFSMKPNWVCVFFELWGLKRGGGGYVGCWLALYLSGGWGEVVKGLFPPILDWNRSDSNRCVDGWVGSCKGCLLPRLILGSTSLWKKSEPFNLSDSPKTQFVIYLYPLSSPTFQKAARGCKQVQLE